ncbi:MAG: hypothetical protein AB1345_13375 [Chloroflexota bacterium]
MKLRGGILLAALLFLVSLITACTLPSPTCDPGALVAVVLNNPPMWGIVSLLALSLSWSYPDSSCHPDSYIVRLQTGLFFADNLGVVQGTPPPLGHRAAF